MEKNDHLMHMEDFVFTKDALKMFDVLEHLIHHLNGEYHPSINVTLKWDGAPSIVAGINPENGRFFVGTKSVFNKTQPKLNYTIEDIHRNHTGGVVSQLEYALRYLPDLNIRGIWQGDMMFTQPEIVKFYAGGCNHIGFQPNTILYGVPEYMNDASDIRKSMMGVAWHTRYEGSTMDSLVRRFDFNIGTFYSGCRVWSTDSSLGALESILSDKQAQCELAQLGACRELYRSIQSPLKDFYLREILRFVNHRTKHQTKHLPPSGEEFLRWYDENETHEISMLKTEKGRNARREKHDARMALMREDRKTLDTLFYIHAVINVIKIGIITELDKIHHINAFVMTNERTGFAEESSHEGFVVSNNDEGFVMKLVDRDEFTRRNFMVPSNRGWIRENEKLPRIS